MRGGGAVVAIGRRASSIQGGPRCPWERRFRAEYQRFVPRARIPKLVSIPETYRHPCVETCSEPFVQIGMNLLAESHDRRSKGPADEQNFHPHRVPSRAIRESQKMSFSQNAIRATLALAALGIATAASAASAQGTKGFDGKWSVVIMTTKGDCDRAY